MILLLGGTADSRAAAMALWESGYDVVVSVVTDHAAELIRRMIEQCSPEGSGAVSRGSLGVRVGALDEPGLMKILENADVLVDATHPFAERISILAREVCRKADVPYLRLERPSAELPADVLTAADAATAAELCVRAGGDGTILVTVGTHTLETYFDAAREAGRRLVARVMPTVESVAYCHKIGLTPADIVAMQGPAGADLDAALLRHLKATVLVTKESGDLGGLTEKLEACRMTGATAIVVLRLPVVRWFRDDGRLAEVATGVEEILRLLEEMSIAKSEWLRGGECQ